MSFNMTEFEVVWGYHSTDPYSTIDRTGEQYNSFIENSSLNSDAILLTNPSTFRALKDDDSMLDEN